MKDLEIDALVNKDNLLSVDYYPRDLVITDENENNFHEFQDPRLKPMVSRAILPQMEKMFADAKKEGFIIVVDSGYRSYSYQKKVLDKAIEEYGDDAYKKVALPGASEHQTGLAFDYGYYRSGKFYSSDYVSEDDPEAIWMRDNSYKYGFILRYPKGKEGITGFQFEPWHYRYVGVTLAQELFNDGITLDEYYARKSNESLKR